MVNSSQNNKNTGSFLCRQKKNRLIARINSNVAENCCGFETRAKIHANCFCNPSSVKAEKNQFCLKTILESVYINQITEPALRRKL